MAFSNYHFYSLAAAVIAVALCSSCAVVETGASVVKATASVASATVGAASTVVGTTVVVGSAAASTASAAKSVTIAAVAAGWLVIAGAQAAANSNRDNDVAMTSVVATAPDRFSATDGRKWITRNCPDVAVGQPALWVATRSGENEIRINAGTRCPVLLLE